MISLSQALYDDAVARLVAAFNGGFIRIFSGTKPADASHAETGTLLGVVTVDGVDGAGLHFIAASDGFYNSPIERMRFRGLTAGSATWFRLVGPGDTGADSVTEPRIDGDIGTLAAPGDMAWASTNVNASAIYGLDSFVYFIHPTGPTA